MSATVIHPLRAICDFGTSSAATAWSSGWGIHTGASEGSVLARTIAKEIADGKIASIDAAIKAGRITAEAYGANINFAERTGIFFRNIFRNFFGYGSAGIEASGFRSAMTSLWGGITKDGLKALGPALAKAGPYGIGLLAAGAALCAVGALWGYRLGTTSYGKFSEIQKGYQADIVNSGLLWGAMSASGFGMTIGCVLALATGGAVGVPLAIAGFVGAVGGRLLRYGMGGHHMINIPQKGIFPLNVLARTFNNQDFVR